MRSCGETFSLRERVQCEALRIAKGEKREESGTPELDSPLDFLPHSLGAPYMNRLG